MCFCETLVRSLTKKKKKKIMTFWNDLTWKWSQRVSCARMSSSLKQQWIVSVHRLTVGCSCLSRARPVVKIATLFQYARIWRNKIKRRFIFVYVLNYHSAETSEQWFFLVACWHWGRNWIIKKEAGEVSMFVGGLLCQVDQVFKGCVQHSRWCLPRKLVV